MCNFPAVTPAGKNVRPRGSHRTGLIPKSVVTGKSIEALITLINVGEIGTVNASINYTILSGNTVIWLEEENITIQGQLAFVKQISTDDLNSGEYKFQVIHYYGDNQTATAEGVLQ